MDIICENFIVFEGLDGCGKTTQQHLLAADLKAKGYKVFETSEPTDSEIGILIRRVLKGEVEVQPETLALLYVADRNEHLYGENGIWSHLQKGEIVICGRYFYSSIAYQGVEVNENYVKSINSFPHSGKIIYLDLPVRQCLKRIELRGEENEYFEKLDYLNIVQKRFKNYFKQLPEGVKLLKVKANDTVTNINKQICDFVFKDIKRIDDNENKILTV